MAELRFSSRALASLRAIRACIAEHDPDAAGRVLAEIERACDLIAMFPTMGQTVPATSLRIHVTRRHHHRVVYRVEGDVVQVRDVLHGRRDWRRAIRGR